MATTSNSIPHTIRTAQDPRQQSLFRVKVSKVDQVNSSVRLIELELPDAGPEFTHLPGQWLDVYIPSVPQAGGFTITSAPERAEKGYNGRKYVELAIQKSAYNPPAAFFWRPSNEILGTPVKIRVGGSFVYPPPDLSKKEVEETKRLVFIAGGVGINPIMSMLEHLHLVSHLNQTRIPSLRLLYGTRVRPGEATLFDDRIARILEQQSSEEIAGAVAHHDYKMINFFTGVTSISRQDNNESGVLERDFVERRFGRMSSADLVDALGLVAERKDTTAYVCGPPKMTDECVATLREADGMDSKRVLCEKWW